MATTIDQIRKVNIYEEDKDHNRTLVQTDVPLGSNVIMESEAPAAEELYLLTGKEDTGANTITLYPTKVKVTSNGSIDATDFTIGSSSLKSDYVSTITSDEGEETSTDGTVYTRRLCYNINNNEFPVMTATKDKPLNLLQVPYLELYKTNAIKTTKNMAKPLLLNVENIIDDNLPNNTKVILGHTVIKNSALDLVDNTNGYLGARLGVDTSKDRKYGYLNFYRAEIKEDKTIDRYETGSIFTDENKNFCIVPRNIYYPKIDEPNRDSQGKAIEELPVVSGYLGTEYHQFKSLWAKTLHGNINVVSYTSEISSKTTLADLGAKDQLIYIGGDYYKSVTDMPYDAVNGFCITLSTTNNSDSPTSGVRKQIFIRGGTKDTITEKKIYLRTCHTGSYGQWQPALGGSSWHNLTIPVGHNLELVYINGKKYYKPNKKAIPYLIFNREYLDIYQNNKRSQITLGLSWSTIYKALNDRTDKEKENNVCIEKRYKRYNSNSEFSLFFGYNDQNQICLWSAASDVTSIDLSIKQYD